MVTTVRRKIKGQYDSIADAKADKTLKIGDTVKTSRYYDTSDGGGAQYIVVPTGTGIDDGGSYHNLANGNQLELLAKGPSIDLRTFGMVSGVEIDQSTQFNRVLAWVKGNEIKQVSVIGSYFLTNTITLDDVTFEFTGASNINDYFVFSGCDGFIVNNSNADIRAPLVFRNVGLYTKDLGLYTGMNYTGNLSNPYNQQFQFLLSKAAGIDSGYWSTCIRLDKASQSVINKSTLQGDSVSALTPICLDCVDSNNVIVDSCDFTYFDVAVNVNGSGGLVVNNNHIIGGVKGVVKSGDENYLAVQDNHFAVSLNAVLIPDEDSNSSNHNHFSDNFVLLYDDIASVTEDFVAFDIASNYNKIHDNEILRTVGTRDRYGVILRGLGFRQSTANQIQHNNFNAMTKGVIIESGVVSTDVIYNNTVGVSRANLLEDNGTTTSFIGTDSTSTYFKSSLHEFITPDGNAFEVSHTSAGIPSAAWLSILSHQSGGVPRIEATGTDTDISIEIRPKGAGLVQFGTHAAIGVETVTGYITIKDANDNDRKIAVVS